MQPERDSVFNWDQRQSKRSSGLFSVLKWFSSRDTSPSPPPTQPDLLYSASSSCDSIESVFSTDTVASFAYVPPTSYRPFGTANQPQKFISPGPETATYRARIAQRELRRETDKDLTLRRKYNLFREGEVSDRGNSLPLMSKSAQDQHLARRTASESSKHKRAGAYCHVKGKRRAPQPPGFKTDGAVTMRRKKRLAPQPPVAPPDVIANDSLKLDHGILKSAKEPTGEPSKPTTEVETTTNKMKIVEEPITVVPRPWYKRTLTKKVTEEKRKSGLSFLTNISELDREAMEIIGKENLKMKYLKQAQAPAFMRPRVSDTGRTDSWLSPKRKSARDLIAKFNALTGVTRVNISKEAPSKKPTIINIVEEVTAVASSSKQIPEQTKENTTNEEKTTNSASPVTRNTAVVKPISRSQWYCPKCSVDNDYWRIICRVCNTIKPYFDDFTSPPTDHKPYDPPKSDKREDFFNDLHRSVFQSQYPRLSLNSSIVATETTSTSKTSSETSKTSSDTHNSSKSSSESPNTSKTSSEIFNTSKIFLETSNLTKPTIETSHISKTTSETLKNFQTSDTKNIFQGQYPKPDTKNPTSPDAIPKPSEVKSIFQSAYPKINLHKDFGSLLGETSKNETKNDQVKNELLNNEKKPENKSRFSMFDFTDKLTPANNKSKQTLDDISIEIKHEKSPITDKKKIEKMILGDELSFEKPKQIEKFKEPIKLNVNMKKEETFLNNQQIEKMILGDEISVTKPSQKVDGIIHNIRLTKTDESAPKTPEMVQKNPEIVRKNPEMMRKTTELIGKTSESTGKASELIQKTTEATRSTSETKQKTTESSRKIIESSSSRKTPEPSRKTPEPSRKTPEPSRKTPELNRKTPEPLRKTENVVLRKSKTTEEEKSDSAKKEEREKLKKMLIEMKNSLPKRVARQSHENKQRVSLIQEQPEMEQDIVDESEKTAQIIIATKETVYENIKVRKTDVAKPLKVSSFAQTNAIFRRNITPDEAKDLKNSNVSYQLIGANDFVGISNEKTNGDSHTYANLNEACGTSEQIKPDIFAGCSRTDTLEINRLLRRLETAISGGELGQAAVFARELAQLKVPLSVIRQKSEDGADKKKNKFSVDIYVEDKVSHRGPFPLDVSASMTVIELKTLVEEKYKIPIGVQRWILGKQLATDDNTTLGEHQISSSGCPVFLYLVAPANDTKLETNPVEVVQDLETNDVVLPTITTEPIVVANDAEIFEDDADEQAGALVEDLWKCPACTLLNPTATTVCEVCATPRDDSQQLDTQTYLQLVNLDNEDLVRNVEPFECLICLGECGIGEGVTLRECLHQFCRQCLAHTVEFSEEAEVKCPYRDAVYACDIALQDREVKALVSPRVYEQHLAKSVKQAENKMDNTFHCKTPDCKGWCIYEDNVNEFYCPVCRKNNCLTCQAIHTGRNCKQYQEQMKSQSETDEDARRTRDFLEDMIKRGEALACPTCQVVLLKKWGCDWLRCSMCKTEICWVTRGPRWGPGGKGDTSGGCKCGVNGSKCHPKCNYCH